VPLLGHGLENDLRALRLCHPTVVDSALVFAHPRGLPIRFRLRALALEKLGWAIQGPGSGAVGAGTRLEGGKDAAAAGHDSLEDALAAGELIRWRMKEEWKVLETRGWSVQEKDGQVKFIPPVEDPEAWFPVIYGAEMSVADVAKEVERKAQELEGEPMEGVEEEAEEVDDMEMARLLGMK
jgi:hypothetical protein